MRDMHAASVLFMRALSLILEGRSRREQMCSGEMQKSGSSAAAAAAAAPSAVSSATASTCRTKDIQSVDR